MYGCRTAAQKRVKRALVVLVLVLSVSLSPRSATAPSRAHGDHQKILLETLHDTSDRLHTRRQLQSISALNSNVLDNRGGRVIAGTSHWFTVELLSSDGAAATVAASSVTAADFSVRSNLPICQSALARWKCP